MPLFAKKEGAKSSNCSKFLTVEAVKKQEEKFLIFASPETAKAALTLSAESFCHRREGEGKKLSPFPKRYAEKRVKEDRLFLPHTAKFPFINKQRLQLARRELHLEELRQGGAGRVRGRGGHLAKEAEVLPNNSDPADNS